MFLELSGCCQNRRYRDPMESWIKLKLPRRLLHFATESLSSCSMWVLNTALPKRCEIAKGEVIERWWTGIFSGRTLFLYPEQKTFCSGFLDLRNSISFIWSVDNNKWKWRRKMDLKQCLPPSIGNQQFYIMPQGLTNALAIIQKMVESVVKNITLNKVP